MEEVDYIVVGLGIAGLAICEQFEKNGCSYLVFDGGTKGSTMVSGGLVNPVVLKRFTAVWSVDLFLKKAIEFYNELSEKLDFQVWNPKNVYRIFNNIEEQNDWMVASDKMELSPYLSSEVVKNQNPNIVAPFGFGKVFGSGTIDPVSLFRNYREFLGSKIISEKFEYYKLSEKENSIFYKNYSAKRIIFTEGAAVLKNPYFKNEYIVPNKGEYIIIKSPKLQIDKILKGPMFVIPLGNDHYKVGATYNRQADDNSATEMAKDEIISKLKKMITCDFEVVDQPTGIRPTTKDRKPLLGSLPESKRKVFFNGLGTRGILMAPYLSEILFDYIENRIEIPKEIDINRMA